MGVRLRRAGIRPEAAAARGRTRRGEREAPTARGEESPDAPNFLNEARGTGVLPGGGWWRPRGFVYERGTPPPRRRFSDRAPSRLPPHTDRELYIPDAPQRVPRPQGGALRGDRRCPIARKRPCPGSGRKSALPAATRSPLHRRSAGVSRQQYP